MGYRATALKVMIASPGDVMSERVMIREVVHEWNAIHADKRKLVLLPVGWETHSHPEMGLRAQEVINKQILADADILIAAFWTRLGTPTGSSASGTAEEISEHISAGKPTLLYFSAAPTRPDDIDPEQYAALTDFKRSMMQNGLIEQYESLTDFRTKLARQLAATIYNAFPDDGSNSDEGGMALSEAVVRKEDSLSEAAKTLLVEGSLDRNGTIMSLAYIGGMRIGTNGKNFIENGDSREIARWKGAIQELERVGYIEDRGGKREVFSMTHEGYTAADRLSPSHGPTES